MEGSVFIDGMDSTEASDADLNREGETEEESSQEEDTKEEPKKEVADNESEEDKPELTDKGTKLDKNPQSAVHQQLANATKTLKQYEQVLKNPAALKAYAQEMGLTLSEAKAEIKEEKADLKDEIADITPDKISTVEQLASVIDSLSKKIGEYGKKFGELDGSVRGITEGVEVSSRAARINNDISMSLKKYPEIDPENEGKGNFNQELSDQIGELYHKIDFDPKTKQYMGRVPFSVIADSIMAARVSAEKAGSKKAQTVVKEKVVGRSVTGSKMQDDDTPDQDLTPEQLIAKQIAKKFRSR